jgi:hypothetical protein
MDEYTKKWFFYSWIERREEKAKFMKDLGCFIGSFSNPEMAKKIRNMENNTYSSDDEGFDQATKFVENSGKVKSKNSNRRRRRNR